MATSLRRWVKAGLRRAGVEVKRWPQSDPLWRLAQLLHRHAVDTVLDIGANEGQFARAIRAHGYSGRIISFEPIAAPYHRLCASAARDPAWRALPVALGSTTSQLVINVANNAAASSSLLPMLERHRRAAPEALFVGTEIVSQRPLDELASELDLQADRRIFIKADVQGYERETLDGAAALLRSGAVVGLQLELSFVPLYEGGMGWREGFDRAAALGLTLMSLEPAFTEASGQMLQADAVFFRE